MCLALVYWDLSHLSPSGDSSDLSKGYRLVKARSVIELEEAIAKVFSGTYYEALLVSEIKEIESPTLIVIAFKGPFSFDAMQKCSNVYSFDGQIFLPVNNLLLCKSRYGAKDLSAQLQAAGIGTVEKILAVHERLKTGYNFAHFQHIIDCSPEALAEAAESENQHDRLIEKLLELFHGEIFHTTCLTNFEQILADRLLVPGKNSRSRGLCQCSPQFVRHAGSSALSLNDLTISSKAQLRDPFGNWHTQILTPWGGNDAFNVSVSLIFDRGKLSQEHIYGADRLAKEVFKGPLLGGRFICESEVCYTSSINLDAVSRIVFVTRREDGEVGTDLCDFHMEDLAPVRSKLQDYKKRCAHSETDSATLCSH